MPNAFTVSSATTRQQRGGTASGSPPPLTATPSSNNSNTNFSQANGGGYTSPPNASFGSESSATTRKSYTGELYGYYYSALSAWGGPSEVKLADHEDTFVLGEGHNGGETNQWTNAKVRAVSYYTYRNRFPAPLSNGADHDAGWGCMIRTGQMMMSEALRRVYRVKLPPQPLKKMKDSELTSVTDAGAGAAGSLSSSPQNSGVFNPNSGPLYSPNSAALAAAASSSSTSFAAMAQQAAASGPLMCGFNYEQSELFHMVSAMFHDHPSAPFGIHAMTSGGARFAKVPCGEWFTPTALARTLSGILEHSRELYGCGVGGAAISPSHPANGGPSSPHSSAATAPLPFGSDLKDKLAIVAAYDGIVSLQELDEHFSAQRAVLLLVPVMLGMGQLDSSYQKAFLKVLECPLTLGIVGGKPKQSLYFIGHQRDTCFYLDPHTVQPAFLGPSSIGQRAGPRGNTNVANVDPSMLLCFYFESDIEHQLFQEFFFTELRQLTEYPLFSYQHARKKQPSPNEEDVVDDMEFDSSSSDEYASVKTDSSASRKSNSKSTPIASKRENPSTSSYDMVGDL